MAKSSSAIPPKPLALLVAAVLLAHLLLLNEANIDWRSKPPAHPEPFSMRLIERAPAPVQTPLKPVVAKAAPPAQRPPAPQPRAAAPRSEQNQALAPIEYAQEAINSIAISDPAVTPEPTPEATEPVATTNVAEVNEVTDTVAAATPPPAEPKASVAALVYRIPPPMRLKYDIAGQVKGFSYSAGAELLWQHDGSHYDARLEISAFLLGSRVQTSTGQLGAQGLEPLRFGDKSRSEQAAHFVRDKGKIVFSANTPEAPLQEGAQDRLSVFMQLGAMLAGNPGRFPPGTTITLPTVSAREADSWAFGVGPEEKLLLPGGEQTAVKLTRLPRQDYDQKLELWLAPALDFMPVRILLSQTNGDFVDQQWRSNESP